jgi:signal transduction histidine kinase
MDGMLKTPAVTSDEEQLILSTVSPGAAQKRLALAVVLGLVSVFLLITEGPLGSIQTKPVAAFVPAYATAMLVCDSITAILLFVQFSILRSRAILVIATGYLFTALILIPWILAFPGVFDQNAGLIGGLQTTSWLYFCQHAGLPLFAISYALLKGTVTDKAVWRRTTRSAIALSVALTIGLVSAVTFVCVAGEALLPRVVLDSRHLSPLWPYAGAPVALLSLSALVVLWTRGRSVLDLWLTVVMCLYTIEIPLSYYPTPFRFSIGWYAVRVIGFVSSTLVLTVLLYEIQAIYAKLLEAVLAQRREREARLMTGDAVAATIAHEVRQPLTAMIASAEAGLRFLDRSMPRVDKAKETFTRIVADGHRAGEVVGSVRAIFRNDSRTTAALDVNELISDVLALERGDLHKHQIQLQLQPSTQLLEVRGDRVQLQQVLLNLITNAIQAMASEDQPRVLGVRSGQHEGDFVIVSVADTGTGIEPQDIARLFTPLFTTKADGMGMGLSICRAIIQAHDGRLWVSPNTPRGSVFQFTLRGQNAASVQSSIPRPD